MLIRYKNLGYSACEEFMKSAPIGEAVVRPSSKGKHNVLSPIWSACQVALTKNARVLSASHTNIPHTFEMRRRHPSVELRWLTSMADALTGRENVTVSWKVADGVIAHIDVREEGKDENAPLALGGKLFIG